MVLKKTEAVLAAGTCVDELYPGDCQFEAVSLQLCSDDDKKEQESL